MPSSKSTVAILVAALFAAPAIALAQTTGTSTAAHTHATAPASTATPASTPTSTTVPADKLIDQYSQLAGSDANAKAMVTGLRNGTDFKLTSKSSSGSTTTTTINPPTGKMGYGNVNIALALAEASLKEQGITNPTPEQLKTALNGGTIKTSTGTVKYEGVLQMRADGKGWGQIAHSLGFKVGDVMKPERAAAHGGKHEAKVERVAKVERADRPVKIERPDRPERPAKVERPDKPERPGR